MFVHATITAMIKVFLSLFLLASVLNLCILIARNYRNLSSYFVLLFVSQVIIHLGYMESPVTIYLGACFSWFFLLMCISELCNVTIARGLQELGAALCTITFSLTLFLGVSSPVFKTAYYIIASLSVLGALAVIISSFFRNRQVSFITTRWLLVSVLLTMVSFIIARLFHLEMPLLSLTVTFDQIIMLVLLERIQRNDVEAVAVNHYAEEQVGHVMLREEKDSQVYVSSNKQARIWFPELDKLWIDKKLESNTKLGGVLMPKLRANMKSNCPDAMKIVRTSQGSTILKIEVEQIQEKNSVLYVFCLRDETRLQEKEQQVREKDAALQEKDADLQVKSEDLLKKSIELLERKKELLAQKKELGSLKEQTELYEKRIEEYQKAIRFLQIDVDSAFQKNDQLASDIIMGLGICIENRDTNTGGHVERTSHVMKIFVNHLISQGMLSGFTTQDLERIIKAAPLHDLGKIAIPDIILNKNGELTDDERKTINTHPAKGSEMVEIILRNINDEDLKRISHNVVKFHHERWDGKGYPTSKSGKNIPLEARIMAIVDVFDALISPRSYKPAFSYDESFSLIQKGSGTQFDPELAEQFLLCRPAIEAYYETGDESNAA